MRYWSREIIRSAFYEDLADYVTAELTAFSPKADESPLDDYPISVDWFLTYKKVELLCFRSTQQR